MFLSLPMLLELRETLQHPKFAARLAAQGESAESLTQRFRSACHEAVPARITPPAELRDPDDVHVLACAVTAEADAIVTGDKDLLALKTFEGIPILKVRDVVEKLGIAVG
jgi:putative PIN family toxin of toxin-antitoxin system